MGINAINLTKKFRVKKKEKGIRGAFKALITPKTEIVTAVNNLSFEIKDGETVGFIGPNGAGKSTTVKMLSGILHPCNGEILVNGISPHKNRIEHVKNIGVVFGQKSQLWWDLPISDTFDLLKKIYKIPDDIYTKNRDIFNDLLELNKFENQQVRQLSLGQRMRADIAAAFLHSPKIVFLDEPTIGLDVVAKEKIREFIKEINQIKKTTLLFTTHDMMDIEKTCNRIIIIDKGIIIFDGSIKEIKDKLGKERSLLVTFGEKYSKINLKKITTTIIDDYCQKFTFKKAVYSIPDIISMISDNRVMQDLTIEEPQIDNIIREIYTGGLKI